MMSERQGKRDGLVLAAILLAAAAARVVCFSGYFGSDDGAYAQLAHQMATGQFRIAWDSAPVFPLRVGFIAPVALSFAAFGINEVVMIGYPFLLSLASVALAYVAGRRMFNARAGLIAAAAFAMIPMDVRTASMLYPDLPAAFWASAGVLLLYWGGQRSNSNRGWALGVGSGLAFGLSWLCKETVVYLLPFAGLYAIALIVSDRRRLPLVLGVGCTFAALLVVESATYYHLTSDFFYRLHATERNYEINKIWFFAQGSSLGWAQGGYWAAVARRLLVDGPRALFLTHSLGLVTSAATIGVLYAAFRGARSFWFPGLWFVSLILIFNFGSSSLRAYRPLPLFDRYMYPVLLPAAIVSGGFIDMLWSAHATDRWRFGWERVVAAGISCLVILVCVHGLYRNAVEGRSSPVERRIARVLAPQDPLYTDTRSAAVLKFFWDYPVQTMTTDFRGMTAADVTPGAYVLLNHERLDFLTSTYGYTPPRFYGHVPANWSLQWHDRHAQLYRAEPSTQLGELRLPR